MTDAIDELERLHAAASQETWTAYRLVHADRDDAMTPEELGEYVKNSVLKSADESGTTDFISVLVEKSDGGADVCHVGNGPTSPANAAFIVAAHNRMPALLATLRQMRETLEGIDASRSASARELRDLARISLDAAMELASDELGPCICPEIQAKDPRRHFKGCPERKPLPEEDQATIDKEFEKT